ncbi:twitchin [Trichonephila inaurata madagascariensis]|uniref:Twitchin n=1 Tax=Trichonephila inaurata madagascariensis TaxID=2747483 RepID=A0A8X6XWQ5_9ARAC|nr:twitchin [Trichonephila inaurata madagascariensis]
MKEELTLRNVKKSCLLTSAKKKKLSLRNVKKMLIDISDEKETESQKCEKELLIDISVEKETDSQKCEKSCLLISTMKKLTLRNVKKSCLLTSMMKKKPNSLLVSLSNSLETASDLLFPDDPTSRDKVVFRTDSSEDFEGLLSICSVPIRTWKPAMSVLPIRRHIQVADGLQKPVLPNPLDYSSVNSQRMLLENSSENEKVFENIYELDSELKSKHNLELLSELEDEPLLNIKSEPKNIPNAKSLTLSEEANKIPPENNATYPDWLCRVSPYFVSNPETTGQEKNTDLDFEAGEEIEEVKPAKAYFCEYDIKQKSVQELLHLAEEVERSFSQKAEQIESLECILQEELFSLEKDLKVWLAKYIKARTI